MNQIPKEHKNIRISIHSLNMRENQINKPFQGGKLLIHHINSQQNIIQMKVSP